MSVGLLSLIVLGLAVLGFILGRQRALAAVKGDPRDLHSLPAYYGYYVALFTAGLGTLLFQLVTGRQVPVFLASSFAFITPIILAKGQFGLAATMGGVMAAGFVYTFLGLAVKIKGTGFIDRLLPPVVIGPVIISIGLAMAPIAANMAMGKAGDGAELLPYSTAMMISMPALLTTLVVAVFGKGIFRLVPIISGVLVGFAMAFYFGVVDTAKIAAAPPRSAKATAVQVNVLVATTEISGPACR